MKENTVERAKEYIREVFINEYSGHDYYHTLRVYGTACFLAEKEGADMKKVSLAALLHDVDDIKLSPETAKNKDKAAAFLRLNGEDEETVSSVIGIISQVSFEGADSVVPDTLEGKCVQDADRLDAIGAVGIARAFAYGGKHSREIHNPAIPPKMNMTAEEYHSNPSTSVNHFYEKLFLLKDMMNTETAKKIAVKRDEFMREYLNEFLAQWSFGE